MFSKSVKRFLCLVLSAMFCVLCIGMDHDLPITANAIPGVYPGQYYMIKNAYTGYYLTMSSTSDTNGVTCTLRSRTADSTQHFKINPYNGSYMIQPRTSTAGKKLAYSNCNSNGNAITLQSGSVSNQLWTITRGTYGYRICAKDSTAGLSLGMNSYNTTEGVAANLWQYSLNISDWIFEPAYQGNMKYFAITELTDEYNDNAEANAIVTRFGTIGYDATRINYPTATQIASNIVSSRCAVFHGHGGIGYIRLDDEEGNQTRFFSENPLSGGPSLETMFSGDVWNRLDYVMFITCFSATGESNNYRRSMIDYAYDELGVSCVTGFKNEVAGGEQYLYYMMMAMSFSGDAITLDRAFAYADSMYSETDKGDPSCPANGDNRVTLGFTNKTIEMN